MKYSQILIGGVLLAVLLFLAACSSQPTQTPVVNETPKDLGTEQVVTIVTPPAQEITPPTGPDVGYDDLAVPEVSVETVAVYGSRFDAKYIFNKIEVNLSSDLPLDWNLLSIYVGNKYYNSTSTYNENISCSKIIDVIKNRSKKFGIAGSSREASICLSPARDMGTPETVSFVATYDGKVLFSESIKIPSTVTTPTLRLK